MKSIEQLRKLSKNPFYTLSSEELQLLSESEAEQYETIKKKQSHLVKGDAAVKVTGKIDKHSSDPIRG